jgi:superfamily II DNA/RNA helicase
MASLFIFVLNLPCCPDSSGLDVPGVALVVNMSVGMTADYVHR